MCPYNSSIDSSFCSFTAVQYHVVFITVMLAHLACGCSAWNQFRYATTKHNPVTGLTCVRLESCKIDLARGARPCDSLLNMAQPEILASRGRTVTA